MENQRYFLKRALKIFFISFFCLQIMGVGFDFLFGKSKIFKLFFLNHHPKAVGFIVGSSKSLTGIDTKLLSDSLGMEIINLSEDDSPLEFHIMTLNYLKEKNRKIKFLCLQYDGNKKPIEIFSSNDYRVLPLINYSSVVDQYFSKKPNYYIYKWIPIAKYIYFNSELLYPLLYSLVNPNFQHRFDHVGDLNYPSQVFKDKISNVSIKTDSISTQNIIARLSNFDHVFVYSSPTYFHHKYLIYSYKNPNIELINLQFDGITDEKYFVDVQHLSKIGKNKLTLELIKGIRSKD